MDLQRVVGRIKAVLLVVSTKVASQMQLVQMLLKRLNIIEKFFAEVAPRVWQDLGAPFRREISMFNVRTQLLNVVNPLLSNENWSAFEADLAEGLLMNWLQMPSQAFNIRKDCLYIAVVHQALQTPQLVASGLCLFVVVKDLFIFLVLDGSFAEPLLELVPGKLLVLGDDDLFKLSLADGTLVVFHD